MDSNIFLNFRRKADEALGTIAPRQPFITTTLHWIFVGTVFFTLIWFYQFYKNPDRYAQIPVYSRVIYWLDSAAATQKTGTFLTAYDRDGGLLPIENISHADDRGHTLLLNLLAYLGFDSISRSTLVKLNVVINVLGLTLFGLAACLSGFALLAVFGMVNAVTELGLAEFLSPDVTAVYVSLFLLSLAAAFFWRFLLKSNYKPIVKAGGFVFCLGLLGFIVLMRQPLGIIGIFGLLTIGVLNFREFFRISKLGPVLLGMFVLSTLSISLLPTSVLLLRNKIFKMQNSEYISSHGFAHILYIGLGVLPNPWNIRWDDANGQAYAETIEPGVKPCTNRYFEIVEEGYKKIVKENPKTVLKIYWEKMRMSYGLIGMKRRWFVRMCYVSLLACPLYILYSRRYIIFQNMDLIAVVGMVNGMVLLQGMLGLPDRVFVLPAKYGVVIFQLLCVESVFSYLMDRGRKQKKIVRAKL